MAEIVLKACAYNPKDRYESAVDMRKALEAVLYNESEASIIYADGDSLENSSVEYVSSTDGNKDDENNTADKKNETGLNASIQQLVEKDNLSGQLEHEADEGIAIQTSENEEEKSHQMFKDETEGTFYLLESRKQS